MREPCPLWGGECIEARCKWWKPDPQRCHVQLSEEELQRVIQLAKETE